jgi:hypothetical protein
MGKWTNVIKPFGLFYSVFHASDAKKRFSDMASGVLQVEDSLYSAILLRTRGRDKRDASPATDCGDVIAKARAGLLMRVQRAQAVHTEVKVRNRFLHAVG